VRPTVLTAANAEVDSFASKRSKGALRCPLLRWGCDVPANRIDVSTVHNTGANVVTRLSQLGANEEDRRGTAWDGSRWSRADQSLCKTTEFTRFPTGGQVAARSILVSPTTTASVELRRPVADQRRRSSHAGADRTASGSAELAYSDGADRFCATLGRESFVHPAGAHRTLYLVLIGAITDAPAGRLAGIAFDVGPGGHGDRTVPQDALHCRRLDAHSEKQCGTGVPKGLNP
jgi:hypothetical protein